MLVARLQSNHHRSLPRRHRHHPHNRWYVCFDGVVIVMILYHIYIIYQTSLTIGVFLVVTGIILTIVGALDNIINAIIVVFEIVYNYNVITGIILPFVGRQRVITTTAGFLWLNLLLR